MAEGDHPGRPPGKAALWDGKEGRWQHAREGRDVPLASRDDAPAAVGSTCCVPRRTGRESVSAV